MSVPSSEPLPRLKAVIFDWAGTTVDHGSRAPALVMQEVFRRQGIDLTLEQARGPMGMAKREHIATLAALPDVAAAWSARHGRPCGNTDIDAMYTDFLPLQKAVLGRHCGVIAGVPQAVEQCRSRGLRIGSSTGYTRELMEIVVAAAREQGYEADCVVCAEDASRGRPAPYLLFEAAQRLDVYPMWSVVNVDDTPVGVTAGRNAGCWSVGIVRTGNGVGLSEEEIARLIPDELRSVCTAAANRLLSAGAHFVLNSVAELPDLLTEIQTRLEQGERPG